MSRNLSRFLMVTALFLLMASILFAKSNKDSKRAWLGVNTQSVDYDLADAFDLSINYGAIVNSTYDDSPADKAGIKEGDIIITINDNSITDSDDLSDIIAEYAVGDEVEVTVMRDGSKMNISATLGERKSSRYFDGNKDKNRYSKRYGRNRSFGRVPPVLPIPAVPSIPSVPYVVFGNGNHHSWHSSGSYIGVSISSLTEQLGDYFGVEDGEGVLITEVLEDTPAEKAGLMAGDVIIEVDGEDVESASDLQDLISEFDEGDMVEIRYIRNKKTESVKVEIAEVKGRSYGYSYSYDNDDFDWGNFNFNWDKDAFNEQMKDFEFNMEDFEKEMQDFNFDFRNFEKNELREMKRELQEDLRELKRDLNQELRFNRRDRN